MQTRFNNAGLDSNGNLTAFSGANTITGADSGVTRTHQLLQVQLIVFHLLQVMQLLNWMADSGDVIYAENRAHNYKRLRTKQKMLN